MGVNFPAHLVIIKSTSQYVAGCYKDYSDTQMLQMIGRAGRPQVINIADNIYNKESVLEKNWTSVIISICFDDIKDNEVWNQNNTVKPY